MKLVWSPEAAAKAYIDTVKSSVHQESSVAELISAMAAGWEAKFIVEIWIKGGAIATSVGLAIAARHTGARHVCIVENEDVKAEYLSAMNDVGMGEAEVVVGEAEKVISEMEGVDFLVVDCRCEEFGRVLRMVKLGSNGAVLVCKNAMGSSLGWRKVIEGEKGGRLVRASFLPVGKGLDIAYVGARGEVTARRRRWIKHIDQDSGEEHLMIIRR